MLFHLIQIQSAWSFSDVVRFTPVPTKSLQSVPIAASYMFDQLKISKPGSKAGKKKEKDDYTWQIAKIITKDVLGYSEKYRINDADATEEEKIMQQNMDDDAPEVKSIGLCKQIKDKVAIETENNTIVRDAAQINSKVTLDRDAGSTYWYVRTSTLPVLLRTGAQPARV